MSEEVESARRLAVYLSRIARAQVVEAADQAREAELMLLSDRERRERLRTLRERARSSSLSAPASSEASPRER